MESLQNYARIYGERERALEGNSLDRGPKEKALEWIAWAKQYVERIDPVKKGFEIAKAGESELDWSDEDPDDTS
jgi:hypothetical protein